jgi:molybdopterin molybdotransferase
LTPLEDALTQVLSQVVPLPASEAQRVSTEQALGRVLAEDLRSLVDVPPADNSAMDGYGVCAVDVTTPGTLLPVSQRIPAGQVGMPLQRGTAVRIFTGAEVPPGVDAVVMQEDCEAVPDADRLLGSVRVLQPPRAGQSVRQRGEDIQAGAVVLEAGTLLTAARLGLAASCGAATLNVMRAPRVAMFSTGDELLMPGEPPRPGAIYNSNRYTLHGLLRGAGCEVTDLGIVADTLEATRACLRAAAAEHDLIITTGGVSVGEEDHVRPAVLAEGELALWQLAIKPGKPFALGSVRRPQGGAALFTGVPGNPVACFVTFLVLIQPLLRRLQGQTQVLPPRGRMRADFAWTKADKRREFLRVRRNEQGGLDLFPNQGSAVLTSAAWGDGLVDLPPGTIIEPGAMVDFLPY